MSDYARQLLQSVQLSEARIRHVLPRLLIRSFDAGAVIWTKGCSVPTWNCVMTGCVAAAVSMPGGRRMPLHAYGPESWFGELSVLSGQPSALDFVCLTTVEVIGMHRNCLLEAMRTESEFAACLLSLMSWRAQRLADMQVMMQLGCSSLRVVMGLAQFAESQSLRAATGLLTQPLEVVDIPIRQEQLAGLCSVSRTLFSAALQQLVKAGWIKVRYGALALQSAQAWRVFAGRQRARLGVVSRPSMATLLIELEQARQQV